MIHLSIEADLYYLFWLVLLTIGIFHMLFFGEINATQVVPQVTEYFATLIITFTSWFRLLLVLTQYNASQTLKELQRAGET